MDLVRVHRVITIHVRATDFLFSSYLTLVVILVDLSQSNVNSLLC